MKKITIITITLNSESTICQTIESVLSQKYDNLEYIIIDGKSTDSTLSLIEKYRDSITMVVSEKDRGISDAFNKGIRLATGEIIGIINSDDLLADNCLSLINDNILDETEIIYGNMITFGDNMGQRLYKPGKIDGLRKQMTLFHPATFIKKSAYKKYGLYGLKFKYSMDRELLLRMYSNNAKFQYIDETLAWFRIGGISDKKYLTGTIPEGEIISRKYGRSWVLTQIDMIEKVFKYKTSQFLRSNIVGNKIRKLYHTIKY